jgi:predicted nucleotide-binding protein
MSNTDPKPEKRSKKASLSQADVPAFKLSEAVRLARALSDELAKKPSSPLQVAAAMNLQPTTSKFRMLASASIAYGLTEGSAWADKIILTPLGKRAVSPTEEGDDSFALREAMMRPRILREFLQRYSGSKWPRADIGQNVLEEMGVPHEQTIRALELIHANAKEHGLITTISNSEYINLDNTPMQKPQELQASDEPENKDTEEVIVANDAQEVSAPVVTPTFENKRVFITHGKKRDIVNQIKVLLEYGEFEPVVAIEQQAGAVALSDKVIDEMRACSAAIIHVNIEETLTDAGGNERQKLNDNVLIEIGAALALYGHRFILLVENGAKLPSNLDGLYQVRCTGNGLDHESTMALLKAFAGFRQSN